MTTAQNSATKLASNGENPTSTEEHFVECALHVWQDIKRAMKGYDPDTYESLSDAVEAHKHKRATELVKLCVIPAESLAIDALADYLDLPLRVWSEPPKFASDEESQDVPQEASELAIAA